MLYTALCGETSAGVVYLDGAFKLVFIPLCRKVPAYARHQQYT
jgi:hypothetical protein